jgi:3-oxoadipate enol-lactonase
MNDREDDFDRGLKNRRAVLGDEWVERALGSANAFNADFQAQITRQAWHDIWGRPGLDHETRRLLVLAMTMALGRWEEFELHCGAAIRGGVPLERIRETLMQGAVYCGVPAANTGFKIAVELLRKEGRLPPSQPLTAAARVSTHHTFSRPQLRVALQGAEEGLPVVMSHALGLDLGMWDGLAAALAPTHPVLRYDHRGHGGSLASPGDFALDDLVEDAARVIREWGRGPVVFIGLSMGGMVGQGLAIRHPGLVRGLVLANTVARYPEAARDAFEQRAQAVEQGGMAAVADVVVERYLHADFRAARPEAARALRDQLLRCDAAAYAATCRAVGAVDWLDGLAEIRCPALVMAGARDVGAPPALAQAIAERIPGAQLEVLPDASHLSVAEQPEAFERLVRNALSTFR